MDPIFDRPLDLPPHTPEPIDPVDSTILCEWPVGTFLENIAFLSNGAVALSIHTANCVEIMLGDCKGSHTVQLPAPPAGLVARHGGGFYVLAGNPGTSPGQLWKVDSDGQRELFIEVEGALFLNGLTPLSEDVLFATESLLGRIYRLDLRNRTSEVWFSDEALKKTTSFAFMPGANGIKIFNRHVYVTNTDRATLIRIAIAPNGSADRAVEVANHLRGDDFAFAEDGRLYITTHIENSVVRLSPDGHRTAIAGPEQGMPGSTAIAFGRQETERSQAFVVTTGGLLQPYNRKALPAKLIRLELGMPGAIIPLAI